LRLSPDGVMMYAADAWHEVKTPPRLYAEIELETMYEAWVNDRPLRSHDGSWGKATTEVCLGLLQSARERRELRMNYQVPF
jgi:phthalate 4,5-cis-dihydrodiol dehydrogenase